MAEVTIDTGRMAEAIAAVDLDLPPQNDRERTFWRTHREQLDHARAIVTEYNRLTLEAAMSAVASAVSPSDPWAD